MPALESTSRPCRTSAVEFEAILRTNFLGAVACTLAVLPGMVRRRAGHIVNVSSPSAFGPPAWADGVRRLEGGARRIRESLLLEVRGRGYACRSCIQGT